MRGFKWYEFLYVLKRMWPFYACVIIIIIIAVLAQTVYSSLVGA